MTNVVSLHSTKSAPASAPVVSPIMFTAYERPLYYKGRAGTEYANTGHKTLVRVGEDNEPITLAVVGESYKMVQNAELFGNVEGQISRALTAQQMDGMIVKDSVAYDGTRCYREYRFPNINIPTPENLLWHFKISVENGFGTGAIKFLAGGEDQICTNGAVRFVGDGSYHRHTKGFTVSKIDTLVERSIKVFWTEREKWDRLKRTVADSEKVQVWLTEQFGERTGAKLFHQYLIEAQARKGTHLWALYSALTYYASHASGEFTLRNTGNDHAAFTMQKRQLDVMRATETPEFMKLAA